MALSLLVGANGGGIFVLNPTSPLFQLYHGNYGLLSIGFAVGRATVESVKPTRIWRPGSKVASAWLRGALWAN